MLTSTSETVTYTYAQQQIDFGSGSVPSTVDIEVFQVSSVVGRGFGTEATV